MTIAFDPAHDDQDYDPEHPDEAHAVTADETDDPVDTLPGRGVEHHPGELPDQIPDVPAGEVL